MGNNSLAINQNEWPCERESIYFHGYRVYRDGTVIGKKGQPIKPQERKRRGNKDKTDLTVKLFYNGESHKWTLQRLVASCFLGPVHGYEINHKDRNPHNCNVYNLERVTASENQNHWRRMTKVKGK